MVQPSATTQALLALAALSAARIARQRRHRLLHAAELVRRRHADDLRPRPAHHRLALLVRLLHGALLAHQPRLADGALRAHHLRIVDGVRMVADRALDDVAVAEHHLRLDDGPRARPHVAIGDEAGAHHHALGDDTLRRLVDGDVARCALGGRLGTALRHRGDLVGVQAAVGLSAQGVRVFEGIENGREWSSGGTEVDFNSGSWRAGPGASCSSALCTDTGRTCMVVPGTAIAYAGSRRWGRWVGRGRRRKTVMGNGGVIDWLSPDRRNIQKPIHAPRKLQYVRCLRRMVRTGRKVRRVRMVRTVRTGRTERRH